MDVKQKIEEVKTHIRANKNVYFAAVGSSVITVVVLKTRITPQIITTVAPVITVAPVMSNTINFGGYTTKIVRRLSDGKIWETVKDAAAAEGVEAARMSGHLNGRIPHINNEVYEIIGVGTIG